MNGLLSIFVPGNRRVLLVVAALLITAIAVTDWLTKPYISLGFLYLFPIIIVGGFLSRTPTIGVALVCAVLQEAFSNLPENEAIFRLVLSSIGFSGTGLFVSELLKSWSTSKNWRPKSSCGATRKISCKFLWRAVPRRS